MAYEDELATLMDEIMHLEHQLYGEKRKSRALERKIADCEEAVVEIQVLQQELIKEKKAKTALKIEVAKKDVELDMLQHQAAAVHCEATKYAEIESLQQELENKRREKEDLEAKVAEFEQSNDVLEKKLGSEKCDNTALKTEVALCEANCAKKDTELEILQKQLNEEKFEKLILIANNFDLKFRLRFKDFKLRGKCVIINIQACENYLLMEQDGHVILAQAKGDDLHQYWFKDVEYGRGEKDCFGSIGFALVNVASGLAMKPVESIDTWNQVQLVPYNAYDCDLSILWSQGEDLGNNYRAIRMLTDTDWNLEAVDKELHNGSNVGLSRWLNGSNQLWKIVP